jgi:hypothetical protein
LAIFTGVALSQDGNILAVGAPDATSRTGYVRVFQYNAQTTSYDQIGLDIQGPAASARFGFSVALSDDGTVLAVAMRNGDGAELGTTNNKGEFTVDSQCTQCHDLFSHFWLCYILFH